MSEANNEQYEVEERIRRDHDHDVVVVEREPGTRGELVKFGLLAVVLLFTVVIIALLRPLIFNQIVPAVLGEGQPAAPLMDEADSETIKPATDEAEEVEVEGDSEAVNSEEEAETTDSAGDSSNTGEAAEPENPEDFPTAVPARTHTIQAGENLTNIAQQYDVTVAAIVEANNLTNPDRVAVGTELIIPEDQ